MKPTMVIFTWTALYNMNDAHGRAAFSMVRELGDEAQWSVSGMFRTQNGIITRMFPEEVSPVTKGVVPGTYTKLINAELEELEEQEPTPTTEECDNIELNSGEYSVEKARSSILHTLLEE